MRRKIKLTIAFIFIFFDITLISAILLLTKNDIEYNIYSFLFLISRKENVYVMVCVANKR